MSNDIKHFILDVLASIFLVLSIVEMLVGINIIGTYFRETGDMTYVVLVIPVITVGVVLFIISSKLLNYKTKYDIEQLEKELGFSDINIDIDNLSAEEFMERYGIRDDF